MTTGNVATTGATETVLTDRRVITRLDENSASREMVLDCTACRDSGSPIQFILPEWCSHGQSQAWAVQVTEHFKRDHR
jgi:hypothetical protein